MKTAKHMVAVEKELDTALGTPLAGRLGELLQPTLSRDGWRDKVAVMGHFLTRYFFAADTEAQQPRLSRDALLMLVQHQHSVHRAHAQCVPLTSEEWSAWLKEMVCAAREMDTPADAEEETETENVGWRVVLGRLYDEALAARERCTWGTTAAARRSRQALATELERAAERAATIILVVDAQVTAEESAGTASARRGLEALFTEAFDPVWKRFGKVSYDEEGEVLLHGEPPLEEMLRELLLEPLLTTLSEMGSSSSSEGGAGGSGALVARDRLDKMTSLVEGWARQSFRRQIALDASSDAERILAAYEEFEVEEKRKDEMRRYVARTRNASFCQFQHAARALAERVGVLSSVETGDRKASPFEEDGQTAELVTTLLKVWEVAKPVDGLLRTNVSPPYRCLYLSTKRMLEFQPFPGSFAAGQLEKVLSYFHSWFARYIVGQHRWTAPSPFTAEDDSDLWLFALSRHSVLLVHGLASAAPPSPPADTSTQTDALSAFVEQWRILHAVGLSVLHAWQTYLSVLSSGGESRASPEKKRLRAQQANTAVSRWFNDTFVHTLAKAFLSDLYDAADAAALSREDEARVLILELQLKMFICDVLLALGAALSQNHQRMMMLEVRRRLRAVIDAVHEFVKERLTDRAGDREEVASGRSAPVRELEHQRLLSHWGLALGRLCAARGSRNGWLPTGQEGVPTPPDAEGDEERDLLRFLVQGYKDLARAASQAGLKVVEEEALSHLRQVTTEYGLRSGDPAGDSASLTPCLPLYADHSLTYKKGTGERIPLGGLLDLACQELALGRAWKTKREEEPQEAVHPKRRRVEQSE